MFLKLCFQNVKKYVTDSNQSIQIFKEIRNEIVEDFESQMREIEEKLKNATKSLQIASCINQIKSLSEEVKTKFDQTFRDNYNEIDENRTDINKMICHFGTSIK